MSDIKQIPDEYPGKYYQPLFDHLHNEFGVLALVSQMDDLMEVVKKLDTCQPPAVKGAMEWVKGAPIHREQTYAEFWSPLHHQYKGVVYPIPDTDQWWAVGKDFCFTVHESKIIAHLDESPTAAAELPYMRKEDYEQIEINIEGGMPEAEACFQSGYSAGHDAGYERGKREAAGEVNKELELAKSAFKIKAEQVGYWHRAYEVLKGALLKVRKNANSVDLAIIDEALNREIKAPAAGDGKEAVAFGEWIIENNWVVGLNNLWWLDNEDYKGTGETTAELYNIKQQNK